MKVRSQLVARALRPAFVLTLTLALVAGCASADGSTGPDGVTLSDLAGTWTATHFVFSQADPGPSLPSVDLVAEGFVVEIVIQSNGSFSLSYDDPAGGTEVQTGDMAFDVDVEDFLLLTFDDEPDDELEFLFDLLNEDSFRLIDNVGEAQYDLDGDGTDDPARINSTWVR